MLFLIGLGLSDGSDITVRGKQLLQQSSEVYLEGYTSLLQCSHEELEQELGTRITVLMREDVEQQVAPVLGRAKEEDVALLVIGDPFGATTHADLLLRAHKEGVAVQVVHNASIMTAVGEVGLELYKYGRTVSLPFWQEGYEPTSFLDGIAANHSQGLHTLCLLDIQADNDRFMTVREGLELLQTAAQQKDVAIPEIVVGVARLGSEDACIHAGSLEEVSSVDFGGPPHCLIVPGKLHPIEEEMLELNKITTKKE